jgi:hypothetical protein
MSEKTVIAWCDPTTWNPWAGNSPLKISVERISKMLRVTSDESAPTERGVISNDGRLIGIIIYHNGWMEWALCPQPNTVWSADCLDALREYLKRMNEQPRVIKKEKI